MKFLNLFIVIILIFGLIYGGKVDLLSHMRHKHKSVSTFNEKFETLYKEKVESYVFKSSTAKKEID